MDKRVVKDILERRLNAATNLSDYALCVMAILELEDRLDLENTLGGNWEVSKTGEWTYGEEPEPQNTAGKVTVDWEDPKVQEFVRGTTPIDPEGLEDT